MNGPRIVERWKGTTMIRPLFLGELLSYWGRKIRSGEGILDGVLLLILGIVSARLVREIVLFDRAFSLGLSLLTAIVMAVVPIVMVIAGVSLIVFTSVSLISGHKRRL